MRILAWACMVALICAATGAAAGAWPRERGTWYASGAVHLSWPRAIETWTSTEPTGRYDALYLEYGLTRKLTLGLDLGRAVSGEIKTIGFLQYPITPQDWPIKAAVQLGFGRIAGRQVVRPGLSLGRGWDGGWLAADALVEQPTDGARFDVKLDMTYGIKLPKERKLILQMQTGQQAGDPAFARFAPSVVFPLRGPLSLELGGTWGLTGDNSMGLKIGLWAEF
ncbi:hypothetical protein [Roseivivax sediminis]|uniref:MetA-pathway of phenol degradation n=1 Tax=Roseivivax sediminis TaxID=936889 RepID=A0A1I1U9N2_9RHOB|nr:hypothetical protein [Roseivivax sediminis]SFD65463.1 hypothetical protein SAMN04515678_102138 [Roseivivax sediminis]